MAQTSLPATHGAARRRAVFGLFNADGWPWAIVKAAFWFVVIVTLCGWIPDRAYYFTVGRTVELWPMAISFAAQPTAENTLFRWPIVNFCPPSNETLPCPAPAGATLPWQPAPDALNMPAPRTGGAAAFLGSTYVFAGGSDGTKASADVWIAKSVGLGNYDHWQAGPPLPEPRANAAFVAVGSTLYVLGGLGADGKPTSTVFSIQMGNDGSLGAWVADNTALPAPRAGGSAVAISDGVVLMGGSDASGIATRSVWKSQQNPAGKLLAWKDQQPLYEANVDGVAMHVGDIIYVIGGRNEAGQVVATVQEGLVGGGPNATVTDPNVMDAYWRVSTQTNLPGPRADSSGFTANGVLYVQGGTDGVSPRTETVWATPDASGGFAEWHHMAETDLGVGVQGSAGVAAGSYAFLFGGVTADGPTAGVARTNLAPQEPFFQAGILGATIPGLKLDGEVGQQIGYLNAATVGAVNFILLILIGYGFNHKEKVRSLVARVRRRR